MKCLGRYYYVPAVMNHTSHSDVTLVVHPLNPVVLSLTIQALLIAFFNKNKDSLPSGAAVEIELIAEV